MYPSLCLGVSNGPTSCAVCQSALLCVIAPGKAGMKLIATFDAEAREQTNEHETVLSPVMLEISLTDGRILLVFLCMSTSTGLGQAVVTKFL